MLTEKIKQIKQYSAKIEALQKEIAKQRDLELAALPENFGFSSVAEFISALKTATAGGKKSKGGKRKKRTRITPELKQRIKAAVTAGKTGAQIADEFGISLPSVQNVKKALGLVKSRK